MAEGSHHGVIVSVPARAAAPSPTACRRRALSASCCSWAPACGRPAAPAGASSIRAGELGGGEAIWLSRTNVPMRTHAGVTQE
jgi:hypothetical protein